MKIITLRERKGIGKYVRFVPNTDVYPYCIGEITEESDNWYCIIQKTSHPVFKIGTEYLCVPKNGCEKVNYKEEKMKNIWEVIVIDKEKNTIICREIVIDGDEKSACSKVSISFADKLKDFVFDNLIYITKQLGSY